MSIYNPECTRCPLAVAPRTAGKRVCVPGEGPTPSDILFYGEAPGATEEEEARPFIGAAGRELDVLTHEAGLERNKDFFIGNPVRCRPPANRRPTEDEVKACLFYTIKELAMVKPKVIVALGGAAIQALTGLEAVGANRGKLLSLKPHFRSDIPVIPTYHPAAFLHNAGRRAEYSTAMIADFKVAKKITQGTSLKARIIHGFEEADAKAAIKEIARCDEVGVDLEWEVLPATRNSPEGKWPWSVRNEKSPQVITYGFAANVDNEYVAVSLPTNFTRTFDKAIRFLALKNLVGHNMMSDAIWLLSTLGEIGKIVGDTYILPTLLNLRMSLRLKSLASTLTEMPPGWDKEVPLGKRPRTTNEWRRLLTYNAQDAIAPLLLHPKLLDMAHEMGRERVLPLYREIQLPAIRPLAQAAINGTPLDVEMVQKAQARADSQLERAIAAVSTTLNLTPAQVKKKKTLAGELERQAGITFPTTAKKQEPQITLDSLDLVKHKHPAVPHLIKKSKLEKLKTTYFDPWLMLLAQQQDNRLHSVTKLSDPSSGRTSAEGEAGATMQQFPRRTKGFRRAVRAREGWGIASVDQSMMELRIAAWLANEQRMLAMLREGKDLHKLTAGWMKALAQGYTLDQYLGEQDAWMAALTDEERYGAKPFNFGLLFGGSGNVVQLTARKDYGLIITREEADIGSRGFFQLYPQLPVWHESCWRFVRQGYTESPLGHQRLIPEDKRPDEQHRISINTPVQGTASYFSVFCANYTGELLMREYGKHTLQVIEYLSFIHDQGLYHFDMKEESTIKAILREGFEHPPFERLGIEFPVPLEADVKVAPTWK